MTQLRQNPLDFTVLDALRQHCELTQSFGVWAEALEQHARAATEAESDPIELGRLHYELGNLYRDQLGRSDQALTHFRAAFDLDGAQRSAIVAARSIFAADGDWEQVADLLSREADSLPPGPKRVTALRELGALYRARLGDREQAAAALREAASYAPEDLQVQHELVTVLLEDADHSASAQLAEHQRREAAELLCDMAGAVSDDYAFAYVEAALDAVPDHAPSLDLLEEVAPRIGRADALAPRWLGAIRTSRERPLTRALRLKMASAYIAVEQFADARTCLGPLLSAEDGEALELARALPRELADLRDDEPERLSEGVEAARSESAVRPSGPAPAGEDELLSSELMLEADEPHEQHGEHQEHAELAHPLDAEVGAEVRDLLEHLSALDRADSGGIPLGPLEPTPALSLDASELFANAPSSAPPPANAQHASLELSADDLEPPEPSAAELEAPELSADELEARELSVDDLEPLDELLDSAELLTADHEPGEAGERGPEAGPANAREWLAQAAAPAAEPAQAPIEFRWQPDENELDPFAEQTQRRAAPLTLAELSALIGADERMESAVMSDDGKEHDSDSEVTRITPTDDPQAVELRNLRGELGKRLRFRDRRGAAEIAERLLEHGAFDEDAIEAMEEHYRLTRDFKRLRDLSMRIARQQTFLREVRCARLREAIMLSETKLGDEEGAAIALRELLELEPRDLEAFEKLRRGLKRMQRWDELAALLSRRALEEEEPHARALLLRELATIERDKRNDLETAISSFARARELDPGRPEDERALSELYLATERYGEAASIYEAQLERSEPGQRPALLATLARLYEEQLADDARARTALEAWRALEPRKPEPLAALIRVLDRLDDQRAVVDALLEQLELAPASHRVAIHRRIAELSLNRLSDPSRAADSYAEAIALTPNDAGLWQAAAHAFERAGRAEELDELLWGIAQNSRDRALQAALFEQLAQTRSERDDLAGAILAREAQFGVTQQLAPLEALVSLLRQADRSAELVRKLDELARRSEPELARALRLERATVFFQKLRDPEAAKAELERLLSGIAPDDVAALRMLIELCAATGDSARRASAQERLIKLAPSLEARVELAVELVDIYERELEDPEGAARVLAAWTGLEPENPQPYLRLVPLLSQAGRSRELLDTLDKLAALAISDEEAGEFLLRASRVAIELEDYDGAWKRLVPRVVEARDQAAEALLCQLALSAGRGEQLAALYVGLAQRGGPAEEEKRRWVDAARVFEQQVGAHDRALEAMLRALAKQLDSEELLSEVERLTVRARAFARLTQVYDTLVRKAEGTAARVRLLMRHAQLLEQRAQDQSAAFERVWLAFQIDPRNDEIYAEARRLAHTTHKREELLSTYERRALSNAAIEARLEALLDACALAQQELEDTARATGYLARGVALAEDSAPLLDEIEERARALDQAQPPIQGRGLLAELAGVYGQLAADGERPALVAASWFARAARLHERVLDDPEAAFRALSQASTLCPGDEAMLDELHRVAGLADNWEGLAQHLQRAADAAIDSRSSSAALRRLGALYEAELDSPSRAADAYEQLVRLRPQDAEASQRLRHCLQAAQRFDELLIAIDRELFMLKPQEGKNALLKQAAETWELGLKNRYEALDAWKKLAAIAPKDPDVVAALGRLRARPVVDDELLLDEHVVVLPEDLRPSLPGKSASPTPTPASGERPDEPEQANAKPVDPELPSFFGEPMTPSETRRAYEAGQREGASAANQERTMLSSDLFPLPAAPSVPEPRADSREFDAEVTLPLERARDQTELLLEGLATLPGQAPATSPTEPASPPAPAAPAPHPRDPERPT